MVKLFSQTNKHNAHSRGLTMIELLIVIVILGILAMVLLWYLRNQPYKARDAKRKSDLRQYVTAFEDYFNDKERYPEAGSLDNCNSTDLAPYISPIRCDPRPGNIPYDYITDSSGIWYAICADLENDTDPDIVELGCAGGCGTDLAYDYCVTVGIPISLIGADPNNNGSGPIYEGSYACDPGGTCNNYANPQGAGCPRSWAVNNCEGQCTIPASTSIPPAVPNAAFVCDY